MFCFFVLQVVKMDDKMYPLTKYFFLILRFIFNFLCLVSFSNFLYFSLLFMFYVYFSLTFFSIHDNIQALIKIIGRLIRQRQNQRIVETIMTPMVPFNIFIDVKYSHVKIASDEATLQMSNVSLGKSIKKFDVFFIEEEHVMLS